MKKVLKKKKKTIQNENLVALVTAFFFYCCRKTISPPTSRSERLRCYGKEIVEEESISKTTRSIHRKL